MLYLKITLNQRKRKRFILRKNRIFSNENINLKKEVEKLTPLVDKLTLSSNKLELLLKDQKDSSNKARIGYDSLSKNRISATKFFFLNASTSTSRDTGHIPKKTCHRPPRTFVSKSTSHLMLIPFILPIIQIFQIPKSFPTIVIKLDIK